MRRIRLVAAMLCGLCAVAPASSEIVYQPYKLFGTGYRDHVTDKGDWSVWAFSHDLEGAMALALYRAAELADAAGISTVRMVDQSVVDERRRSDGTLMAETATLLIRPVRGDADLTACQMRHKERCLTFSVAKMMARYGGQLGQPVQPRTPGSAAASRAYGAPTTQMQADMETFTAQRAAILAGYRRMASPPADARPSSPVTGTPSARPAPSALPAPAGSYDNGKQAALAAMRASGMGDE